MTAFWALIRKQVVDARWTLGFSAADLPALGALHGINALLLFATALFAGRRARVAAPVPVDAEQVSSAAQV